MLKKIILILLFPLAACQKTLPPPTHPTVLVSVAPYAYFVHKIAGPNLSVHILTPETANPHIYEPKPKEVEALGQAKLWIRLGDASDQKLTPVFQERSPQMAIIDVTKGIDLISSCSEEADHCAHDEGGDLHIWLSPRLAKIQATSIAHGLIDAFPEHKEMFTHRLFSFLQELDVLNQQIASLLAPKAGEAILVSHPAFAYFCRDYHLIQLSIEVEGKDPLPQDITSLITRAKQLKIGAVLLQPQYSNKGALLIAEKLHLSSATVNPYAEDYVDNLRRIAHIIADSP